MPKRPFVAKSKKQNLPQLDVIPNNLQELMEFLEMKFKESNGADFISSIKHQDLLDVNFKNENNTTLLMCAAMQNSDIATMLIRNGADINSKDKNGNTALILAVKKGSNDSVQNLIETANIYPSQPLEKIKKNIDTANIEYETALIIAAEKGYLEIMEMLLNAGGDIEIKDDEGNTPLMIAVKYGHYQVIQKLIEAGADINALNAKQESALAIAVREGHVDIIYKLISAGVDINCCDDEGDTALLQAIKINNLEIAGILINAGADIDIQNKEGNTALMVAVRSNKLKPIELILAKCPDLEKKDAGGNTALMLATKRGYVYIAQVLVDEGANIYAVDNEKKTILQVATKNGYADIVSMLVIKDTAKTRKENESIIKILQAVKENDCDKATNFLSDKKHDEIDNIKNKDDFTILMLASLCGHLDMVRLIIKKRADINTQDKNGFTALMYAVKSNHPEIVQLLIDNEANLNLTDKVDATAILHAINAENLNMVQLLLNNGTSIPIYNNDADMENDKTIKNCMMSEVFVRLVNKAIISHPNIVKILIEKGQEFDESFFQKLQELNKSVSLYETKKEFLKLLQDITELTKNNIDEQNDEGYTALMLVAKANYTGLMKLLISQGANLNIRDEKDFTAVMYALNKGNLDAMQLLIEKGAEIPIFPEEDVDDYAGLEECDYVQIILAAIRSHPYIVKKLIEAGQSFDRMFEENFQDYSHLTPLEAVIRTGNLDLVKTITGLDDSNSIMENTHEDTDSDSWLTEMDLAIAVRQGFIDIVKLLARDVAKSNIIDYGPLSLITAICGEAGDGRDLDDKIEEFAIEIDYKTRLEMIRILLDAGIDVNAKSEDWSDDIVEDMYGFTPLMLAVKKGHIEMVEMLLDAGADVNLKEGIDIHFKPEDTDRNTALTYAFKAEKNNVEIIGMLLKAGADINVPVVGDFVEKYKAITVEKGISSNDYYSHIDNVKNYNSLTEQAKEQLAAFFIQAMDDFNLECVTLWHKLFDIPPCPITQLIELKQEGVKWQEVTKNSEDDNKEQTTLSKAKIIIDFYQQHYNFKYDLEEFLKSDKIDKQQIDILKRDITSANIQILKENHKQLIDKDCISEAQTLFRLSLPNELKTLLQKLLTDCGAYHDLTTEDSNDVSKESDNNSEKSDDEQSEHTDNEAVEISGISMQNKKIGSKGFIGREGYDSIIVQLADETDLDIDQLQILFETVGGRVEDEIPNFQRIMNITGLKNLLGNNEDRSAIITLDDLGNFFQNNIGGDINIFERVINTPDVMNLLGNNEDRSAVITLDDLGKFFQNNIGSDIDIFERVLNTPDIMNLLGDNEYRSAVITLDDLGNFFQNNIGGDIDIFERIIKTSGIVDFLNTETIGPEDPGTLKDLGNFFQHSTGGNIEIFNEITNNRLIKSLLGNNYYETVFTTIDELRDFFQNALGSDINLFRTVINNEGIINLLEIDENNESRLFLGEVKDFCLAIVEKNKLSDLENILNDFVKALNLHQHSYEVNLEDIINSYKENELHLLFLSYDNNDDLPYTKLILEYKNSHISHGLIKLAYETSLYQAKTDWQQIEKEISVIRLEAALRGESYQYFIDSHENDYEKERSNTVKVDLDQNINNILIPAETYNDEIDIKIEDLSGQD